MKLTMGMPLTAPFYKKAIREAYDVILDKVDISLVVIEKEHDHEIEQYWEKISSLIKSYDLPVLVNPKVSENVRISSNLQFFILKLNTMPFCLCAPQWRRMAPTLNLWEKALT